MLVVCLIQWWGTSSRVWCSKSLACAKGRALAQRREDARVLCLCVFCFIWFATHTHALGNNLSQHQLCSFKYLPWLVPLYACCRPNTERVFVSLACIEGHSWRSLLAARATETLRSGPSFIPVGLRITTTLCACESLLNPKWQIRNWVYGYLFVRGLLLCWLVRSTRYLSGC